MTPPRPLHTAPIMCHYRSSATIGGAFWCLLFQKKPLFSGVSKVTAEDSRRPVVTTRFQLNANASQQRSVMFLLVFQRNQKHHQDRVNGGNVFYLAPSDPAEPRTSSVQPGGPQHQRRSQLPQPIAALHAEEEMPEREVRPARFDNAAACLQTSHSQHSRLKHNKTLCSSEGARTPGPKRRDPPLSESALGHT